MNDRLSGFLNDTFNDTYENSASCKLSMIPPSNPKILNADYENLPFGSKLIIFPRFPDLIPT